MDVAIGGLAINEQRERSIDFTHSYFHTGLGILVKKEHALDLGDLLKSFLTKNKVLVIAGFFLFMILSGHVIWLVERNQEKAGRRSFSSRYFPGVLDGSTSQEFMREINSIIYSFDRIEDAYKWLINGRLDAVVYDRPNLQYFALHEGKNKVEVVSRTFSPQDYGMGIQQGSPLRERLNRVLLAMRENGILEEIRYKWFGIDP